MGCDVESLRFGRDSAEEHPTWYCSHGRTSRAGYGMSTAPAIGSCVASARQGQTETTEKGPGVVWRVEANPRRFLLVPGLRPRRVSCPAGRWTVTWAPRRALAPHERTIREARMPDSRCASHTAAAPTTQPRGYELSRRDLKRAHVVSRCRTTADKSCATARQPST